MALAEARQIKRCSRLEVALSIKETTVPLGQAVLAAPAVVALVRQGRHQSPIMAALVVLGLQAHSRGQALPMQEVAQVVAILLEPAVLVAVVTVEVAGRSMVWPELPIRAAVVVGLLGAPLQAAQAAPASSSFARLAPTPRSLVRPPSATPRRAPTPRAGRPTPTTSSPHQAR